MALKVCVLGSGSTGNCIFVQSEQTTVLVDLGLSAPRVEKCLAALGANPDEAHVVFTHAHSDHIGGAESFCRRHPGAKLYCHDDCFGSIYRKIGECRKRLNHYGGDFYIGDVTVSPFRLSHDVPCVGYGLLSGGKKVTVATDTGVVPETAMTALLDSDLVIIESNHDPGLLRANASYSPFLKQRILSGEGHLSNEACDECVYRLVCGGVRQIMLAHLSRENNYPELAFESCKDYLLARGKIEGRDFMLEVAYPDKMSSLYEIS